ncbi:hypothetical protein JW960_27130 [candidate division KSB1 bacterium]|nr:hypothetical protein [candidate division KSB1 bacterium]
MNLTKYFKLVCIGCVSGLMLGIVNSNAQEDTTAVVSDTAKISKQIESTPVETEPEMSFGEIELLEINIEAIIEKPRVSILPNRQEPKLEEMEFMDRSFSKELKKAPDAPMMVDERMQEPDKIEQLRDKIKRKKTEKTDDK